MVSFADSIKLGFEGYLKFSGRSTRSEYWWWTLFAAILVPLLAGIIDLIVFGTENGWLRLIVSLALLLPNIAVSVRRLHDIGKSGLWLLWWFLMVIGTYIIIVIGALIAFGGVLSGNWDNTGSWGVLILGFVLAIVGSIGVFIWWIIWFVKEGDLGPNQYGPDPRVDVSYSSEASSFGETVVEKSVDDSSSDGMICPACYSGNRSDSKFCKKCGEKF